jgi:nucleoside-diphosphate-sugar epimerase
MKIGVTGACGYVGSALIPHLGKLATQVDLIDLKNPPPTLSSKLNPAIYRFVQMDVANPSAFAEVAKDYDIIIHLAALVGYPNCNKDPLLAERWNVLTTENVLRFKRKDASVLFSSTVSNYGSQSSIVDEKTPTLPNSVYGHTKKKAEQMILNGPGNIIFRFAGAFGVSACMRNDNLIHDFVSRATSGDTLSVYESHYLRQFIHVQDMAGAIVFAVQNWDQMAGNIYNVGNPAIEITKRDLVEIIARNCDFEYRFENSGTDIEKRNYPISFKKILNLGFHPQMALEPAIIELVRYYQSHPLSPSERQHAA